MKKTIITDLDNTLLMPGGVIGEYTKAVLADCRRAGHRLVIATARPERMTKSIQQQINPDFVIADNGAMVFGQSEILRALYLPLDDLNALIAQALSHAEILQISVDTLDACLCNHDDSEQMREFWKRWNAKLCDFSAPVKDDCPKLNLECTNPLLIKKLLSAYPSLCYHANSGELWYQIMALGATKFSAVRFLCDNGHFMLADTIAFGDDHNDLEMLKGCAVGVAVGNSAQPIRDQVANHCPPNSEEGVARWIEQNLLA